MSRRGAILQDYGGTFPAQSQEAQLAAANYYQRDKELAAQQRNQKDANKSKNQGDAIDYIDKLKGDAPIGDTTIDNYNNAQLQKVKDGLVKRLGEGADINQIKLQAMQELPKIAQGYTIAKNGYDKIKQGLTDVGKDLPSGNTEAARNVMGNEFLKDIFDYNQDGTVKGYKDISLIPQDKDYTGVLMQPDNVEKWYPNTNSALVKNIHDTRGLQSIKGTAKFTDSRGGMQKKGYSGQISIYDKPTLDDENQMTGFNLDREVVPLGVNKDGMANVVEVMPKDKFDVLKGSGASALEFDMAVNRHIQNDLGLNPKKLDPAERDIYERKYALDLLKNTQLQGSQYNPIEETKAAPVKNITNVRVGSSAAEVKSIDVYTPLRTMADNPDRVAIKTDEGGTAKIVPANFMTDQMLGVLLPKAKLQGGEDVSVANMYVRDIGGKLYMFKAANDGKVSENNDVNLGEVTQTGANVTANQPLGVKSKAKAVEDAKKAEATKPKPKKDPLGLF